MGEARVELQDREGRPIDGFGAADCDRLTCNDVAARVRWRGSEDLGALRGRPVGARAHALAAGRSGCTSTHALGEAVVAQRSEMPHPGLLVAAVPQQPHPIGDGVTDECAQRLAARGRGCLRVTEQMVGQLHEQP